MQKAQSSRQRPADVSLTEQVTNVHAEVLLVVLALAAIGGDSEENSQPLLGALNILSGVVGRLELIDSQIRELKNEEAINEIKPQRKIAMA